MTAQFSYTDFFNQTRGNNNARRNNYGSNNSGGRGRPASPAQKKLYYELCERKRQKPANVERWDSQRMSREIDRLMNLPQPASEAQIEKVLELQNEIISIGGDLKPLTEEQLNSLTGGRDGTASSLISTLTEKRKEMNHVAPPTEQQINTIGQWFLCPDIPFESWGIEKKVTLERMTAYSTEGNMATTESGAQVELNESYWRLMTPNEFAEELKKKLTQQTANEFIGRYQSDFYAWRRTRVTERQVELIRQLEEDLSVLEPTSFGVEFVIRNGEIVEEGTQRPESRRRLETHNAYNPLSELELIQMSFEDASKYIDQLRYERDRMREIETLYGEDEIYNESQNWLEEKGTYENDEGQRVRAMTHNQAKEEEWNKMIDLVFAMESLLGYNVDMAHEIVGSAYKEGVGHADEDELSFTEEEEAYLRGFFLSTIQTSKEDNIVRWARDVARLYDMVEDCQTVLDILPDMEEL